MNQGKVKSRLLFLGHATFSLVFLGFSVWLIHVAAHSLVNKHFYNAQPKQLLLLVFLAQTVLIGMFTLIIGSFVHRYPEPFFILWYFGWIAWFVLYSGRFLSPSYPDSPFNLLNTCFFLAAAADLLLPRSLNRLFRKYPPSPGKTFGSPLVWLLKYYKNNPYALLLLTPVIIVPFLPAYFETGLAVIAIAGLGYGLYRRLVGTSVTTAFSALFLHTVYLEPQISKLLWPPVLGHDFDYILTVSAPSLVLKPALALFVTFLALSETRERQIEAQRELAEAEQRGTTMLKEMMQNLPGACLLFQNGKSVLLNDSARKLLGLSENQVALESVFAFTEDHHKFLALLHADGHTIGHLTRICTNSPSGAKTNKWVRMDAFEAHTSVSDTAEIVMLILDHHELELTYTIFSFIHDYISPRVNLLKGSVDALGKLPLDASMEPLRQSLNHRSAALVEAIGFLREEFREYWRLRPEVSEGAPVERCLHVAWAQALHSCAATLGCTPHIVVRNGSFPENTRSLVVSERQLTRTFQNLLVNAIQHTHNRENHPSLSPIEVDLSYQEKWVRIRIADHGCGLPDDVRRFLNEPASTGGDKIGLGLFSVKISVSAAGGKINAGNNAHANGGWVEIRLPASAPQPAAPPEPALAQGAATS
jgi:signal transduction histidine kinase